MRLLNTELTKLGNNRFYWFAMSFYMVLLVLIFYGGFVMNGYSSLMPALGVISDMGLLMILVLFTSFVTGMVCGQEFQYNSFKYELISGRTRNEKALAGFLNILLQVVIMTSLLFVLAVVYFVVVHRTLPAIGAGVGVFMLKFFAFFLCYSLFVYSVALLSRHGIATIFITVTYFIMEMLVVQYNLLKLDAPEQVYPYLLGRGLLDMLEANWLEVSWLSAVQTPFLYALVFALIAFWRVKRMQFK